MKQFSLITFILLGSNLLQAQQLSLKTINGKVSFNQDNTDWIATIIEKDTVSVLFKMMFDKVPTQKLPPNGVYQIVYSSNVIEFTNKRDKRSYAFGTDNGTPISDKKGLQSWPIIGLARMNPVCFPDKK